MSAKKVNTNIISEFDKNEFGKVKKQPKKNGKEIKK